MILELVLAAQITITGIESATNGIRITWKGAIPPYKLQILEHVSEDGDWKDASWHIYEHSYVVSNGLSEAYYRIRSIPDRIPPPALKGFGPRQVTCNAVAFSWDPSNCNDPLCADYLGGSGLRGYRIYRNGVTLTEVPFPTAFFIDTTVLGARTYYYWATAVDEAGNESPRSGTREVVTPACFASVTLAWDPNPEPDIAGYVLRYGVVMGLYSEEMDVKSGVQTTVTELIPGITYYFVVSAYNLAGLEGDFSNEVVYLVP